MTTVPCMDPVSLIVGALAAGVSATGKAAVQDAYEGLKRMVGARLAGRRAAEVALAEHEADPDTWYQPLAKAVAESGAARDEAIVAAAQRVMALLDADGMAAGKYVVNLGDSQGVQIGDSNQQVNLFGPGSGRP
jgi:hypothetical protein